MKKYIIGSKALGLNNNKDIDYLVINDELDYKRLYENGEDIVYRSKEHIDTYMNYQVDFKSNPYMHLINYQLDQNIISSDFPLKYNVLNKRKELIKLLNYIVDNKLLNFSEKITSKNKCCTSVIYHVAYNMFILKNNSSVLTNAQKSVIQKIHDCQMPIEYLKELEIEIKSFKKEVQ